LCLSAQTQVLPFDHISLGAGQDINCSYNIMQDRQGFMWFGTLDGLVRYDGYNSQQYSQSNGLKGRRVNHVEEDKYGHLWVVSGRWLQVYISEKDAFHDIKNLDGDSTFHYSHPKFKPVMVQDSTGTIWMRSTRGVFRIEPGEQVEASTIRRYRFGANDGAANNIQILLIDSQQRLWAGTNKGLLLFDREKDRLESIPIEIDAAVIALCESADGNICIGTDGVGFIYYDPVTQNATKFLPGKNDPAGIAGKTVHQIASDGKGNIWLFAGSFERQIFSLQMFDPDSGRFRTWLRDEKAVGAVSLLGGVAFRLFTDRGGNLWAVTGNGLKRFDLTREQMYDIQDREDHLNGWSGIYHFYEDRTGVVWLGTLAQGVVTFAPSTLKFKVYAPKPDEVQKLISTFSIPLYIDSRDYFWKASNLGTERYAFDVNGGLQKVAHYPVKYSGFAEDSHDRLWMNNRQGTRPFDLVNNKFLAAPPSMVTKNSLWVIMEDDEGWLWSLARGDGLIRFNPVTGDTIHFQHERDNPNSLGSGYLNNNMLKDSEGHLWLGGGGGLNKYDLETGIFTHYLEEKETVEIFEDSAGRIWVTTTGIGLYRIDKKTGSTKKYGTENGFPTNRPLFIQEDDHGNLWISSDVGLIHFQPDGETWQVYDEADGLPTPVFAYGTCKRKNGEMFFPMWGNNFIRFHPDSIRNDTFWTVTAITSFKLFNKKVEPGGENSPLQSSIWTTDHMVLNYDQNVFTLEYAAFHYAAPGKNRFAYFMEGLDEEWNQVGTQRIVNFAGMQPGEYTFRVKAASHDGVWGEPTILKITILPPWWATWWAYLGYLLVAGAAAFAFYYYKKRQWQLRANLEAERREAGRLKELDAFKTNFYTNITHEFRTPLTIILGMVDQIKSNPKDWYSEGLQMIKRSGTNLLRLVNQMLDLSKLEAGALPVDMVSGDVIAYLKYILESFHSVAESKNIGLRFHSKTEEFTMDYDPEKMREIISNLVSNAIKFTPEGGMVIVKATPSRPSAERTSQNLFIVVEDTGLGIPPENLPHIFDRFYQAGDDTKRQAGGAGIGLALTKELVKLLGGEISVRSEVGKESAFTVKLPVKRNATQSAAPQKGGPYESLSPAESLPPPETESDGGKLLIVEDNADVVRYLQSVLANGYEIAVATNGREGIEKAIETIPDLIISDVMMPEADGFELCETLKKDERTSHIPIILLTAKADARSRIEGLELGADAYLAKPFDKEELIVRLRKMLELRKVLQERYSNGFPLTLPPDRRFERDDGFMKKLANVLEERHADENFDITELCRSVHMSRSQCYRKIVALTGKPAGQLLRSFRLQKAKTLLTTSSLSISQIALDVGFKYLAHFSRSFQQEFGVNPSEMRQ
jgi:signal transduction histidine kinase/ligand-binding sensor domain-containing protein/DNA-binding response OmpR family regulator